MPRRPGLLSRIPKHAWIGLAVLFGSMLLVYYATRLVLPHLTAHVLTGPLDARIPFSPPWVTVYVLSYPFWLVSALWILSADRAFAWRFCASFALAMAVSCAVFLLWPGTMARPEVTQRGFFADCVRFIYLVDSPTNLCPSLHVLNSYFCFRGALESKAVPRPYAAFSLVFFLLVCCSVLLVKQHALIDVPVAVVIAEACLQCGRLLRAERVGFAMEHHFRKE